MDVQLILKLENYHLLGNMVEKELEQYRLMSAMLILSHLGNQDTFWQANNKLKPPYRVYLS